MKKLNQLFIIISLVGVFTTDLLAQTNCNNDGWVLPCNKSNNRFTSDNFDIPRPALSLRGFDNTIQDEYVHFSSSKVYGVRQLLEKIFGINTSQDQYALDLYEFYVSKAELEFKNDSNFNREYNASVLEAKALLSLISYIIEKNDNPGGVLEGENVDHTYYRNELINELENRNNFIRNVNASSAFKSGK
ncbi:MAG: hypothetical protein WD597_13575 [Balneolaceae bacterium]